MIVVAEICCTTPAATQTQNWDSCTGLNNPTSAQRIEACTTIIESKDATPDDRAKGFGNRGVAYQNDGERERAIRDFQESLRLDGTSGASYRFRGNKYRVEGNSQAAIAEYNEAIRLDPIDAFAFSNRGIAHIEQRDYDQAIADFNEAIRISPKFAAAFGGRGYAYLAKPDISKAIEDLDEAIRDYDSAIADFSDAIRQNSKASNYFIGRGSAHQGKGNYASAIADYDEAIQLNPKSASALYNRGNALRAQREYDRAIADYSGAIELSPKYAAAFYARGMAYRDKGDFSHAAVDFDQSIKISPGFAAAYTNLCGARIAAGENLRAAISDCNESLALEPKQVFAFNHRGFANLKLGSVSKAIADFDAALSNDAKFAWSLYGRGLAKWKKGDEKGAEADVAAASKIRPDIAKSVGKYYGVAAEADFATRIFAAYARVNPMIFVMAKGDADACGPGCDEWIAAEGVFDIGVEKRFRNFLSTLKGRNLPIFFNSSGGFLQQSYGIGRILRSRKMTAIIGATFPEGCAGNLLDDICRRKIQSGTALKAHLRIAGARCYSGCVYALMGASVRQVPAGTFLGVHAPPRVDEKGHAERRRYARQMDIDPELVDLADKIPYFDMYSLSRDEIARFRIEAPQR